MPMIHEGNEVLPMLPDGEPADVVYYSPPGTSTRYLVAQAIRWLDDLEHQDVASYYYIDNQDPSIPHPHAVVGGGYDGTNRLILPDGFTNHIYTDTDTPGNQSQTIERYFPTGTIGEFYFKPTNYDSSSLLRFFTGGYDHSHTHNQLVIPFDGTSYWRLEYEDGSSDVTYYGNDPQEEGSLGMTAGDWHRLVLDKRPWPDVEAHLWNASIGSHLSTLSTSGGSGTPDGSGFGMWWNTETAAEFSKMSLIDGDDI